MTCRATRSAGRPRRARNSASSCWARSSVARPSRTRLVSTGPGYTIVTPIPSGCNSARSASLNPRTANLEAQYPAFPGNPTHPKQLPTVTMCPVPAWRSCGKNTRQHRTVPPKLTRITQSNAPWSVSANGPASETPALLTSRAVGPCCRRTSAATRATASSSQTSAVWIDTAGPAAARADRADSSRSSRTSIRARRQLNRNRKDLYRCEGAWRRAAPCPNVAWSDLRAGLHIADRAPITGRIHLHVAYAVSINDDGRRVPQVYLRQVFGKDLLDL